MIRFDHHTQFVTVTCLNWLPLLENDLHKQIVPEALRNRVNKQQVTIYAFVLMPNHIHFIWQLHDGIIRQDFQRDLLKFTARSILAFMKMNNDRLFDSLKVSTVDRNFRVWERSSLSIDLYTEKVFIQTLAYIHANLVHHRWQLATSPEKYRFSSARFYETGIDEFEILTHVKE